MSTTAMATGHSRSSVTRHVGEHMAWVTWPSSPGHAELVNDLLALMEEPAFYFGIPTLIRLPHTTRGFTHSEIKALAEDLWHLAAVLGRVGVVAESDSAFFSIQALSRLLVPSGMQLRAFRSTTQALEWIMSPCQLTAV